MPVIFLTIVICFFNVFLWIILLKKFKKMFSTEDIIASTREELNKMIEDMNRNTGRDLNLADAKIKELKSVISEAERRLGVLNSDLIKQVQNDELKASLTSTLEKKQEPQIQSGYFSPTRSPVQRYVMNQMPSSSENIEVEKEHSTPEISYAENPIQPKKDFSQSVKELYSQGLDVEFIARTLNTTTTEVQLIIDMNF